MRFSSALFIMLALLISTTDCFSAPAIEEYGNLPATSKMVLSADGNKIAFRRFDGKSDTLVVYSLKENKLVRVVDVASVVPESIYFISSDQLIIRASSHKKIPGFKGTHDISGAYVLNVQNGKLEQLLRLGDNVYIGQANISKMIGISKNKKFVYMPAKVAKKDSRSYSDQGQGASNLVGYAVMKVELDSPNRPTKVSNEHDDAIDYFMGPNDKVLVEERYSEYTNNHEILVKKGSKWKSIYSKKVARRTIELVGLTPDYKSLVVLAFGENNRRQYYTMSIKDGSLSDSGINSDDLDVEGVIKDINRVVYGVRYGGFFPSYKFFNEKLNERFNKIVDQFSGNSVLLKSWSDDWKKILIYVSGSNFSGEYYLFDNKLTPTFLGSAHPKITNDDVHPIAVVTVTAKDGLKIPTLLTIPRDKVSAMKNLPAVVMPHGGPYAYDAIGFNWIAQALANEGYMVIQPQFRGSDGFGWGHVEAGEGEWGGKMLDDINDSLDFVIKKGLVNKDRVCIAGGSYGGYAALSLGANTPDKYQCIVSINGVANMVDFLREDLSKFGKYHSWLEELEKYVDLEEANKDKLIAISPYYKAKDFKAPVLLIHGENDGRVDLSQSKAMASRLKKEKKQVTMIELDDENHYLQKNESRLKVLSAMVSFINTHLEE